MLFLFPTGIKPHEQPPSPTAVSRILLLFPLGIAHFCLSPSLCLAFPGGRSWEFGPGMWREGWENQPSSLSSGWGFGCSELSFGRDFNEMIPGGNGMGWITAPGIGLMGFQRFPACLEWEYSRSWMVLRIGSQYLGKCSHVILGREMDKFINPARSRPSLRRTGGGRDPREPQNPRILG